MYDFCVCSFYCSKRSPSLGEIHYNAYLNAMNVVWNGSHDRLAKKLRNYNLRLQNYKMSSLVNRRKVLDLIFLHKLFNGAVE